MVVQLRPCPASLRAIQPYLKVALEHDEREPVVSYWCRLYSLQTALNIDKKSDDAKVFLLSLMDWLEKTKRASQANESITSEVAAQAYIENYAFKLFVWADNMDRSSNFNKNVVKSFYTSGLLMDVLTTFGELTEEVVNNRKYAKWKAAYINNCLKKGETPQPGPSSEMTDEEKELNEMMGFNAPPLDSAGPKIPPPSATLPSKPNQSDSTNNINSPVVPSQLPIPQNTVSYNPHPTPSSEVPQPISGNSTSTVSTGNAKLDPTLMAKAQKYCKFASSALNYDDIPEAIINLEKALKLLQSGKED